MRPTPSMLRQAVDILRSVAILRKRGLINPLRPDDSLRTLRAARKAGPFVAMISYSARNAPDAPAIVDSRRVLTYGELEEKATVLARGLQQIGIRSCDVAGVLCRDHNGMALSLIAAGKLDVRLVFMNTGFAEPQVADVARCEQVTVMFVDSEFVPLLGRLPDAMPRILTWVDDPAVVDRAMPTVERLTTVGSRAPMPLPAQPGGIVLLTSGTTGTPRGTPRHSVSPLQSAQLLDRIPLSRRGAIIVATPLFHGTGLAQFILALTLGKKVVLQQRKFDPTATLEAIAEHYVDTLVVVPTMLQRIVDLGPSTLSEYDTLSLRIVVCAGSALSPDLCRRTASAFGNVLYNVYGSTEVANAAIATPVELRRAPGTVGRPPVGCRVALYDERRIRIATPNTPGTIFVGNASVAAAYSDGGRKESVDGMLSTGDIGHLDRDGLLFVDGREDEMIVSGGENVFPQEVENTLANRQDIADAAVVGVADRDFGQRLRAFVVPAQNATLDPQEIKDYVKANLARYKVPRDVIVVDAIPRNSTGKILRRPLEEVHIK